MDEAGARRFFRALSEGDADWLGGVLTDDVLLEFPGQRFGGRFTGKRKVLVFLRQNRRLFEDGLTFTVHWAGVAGDRVVAQWTNAGRTRTGIDYSNRGVTVFVVQGGLITELHDYLDTAAMAETWPR